MLPMRRRRAITALVVLLVSVAYVGARAEGVRPGHECPMTADHEAAASHHMDGAHGAHHEAPDRQSGTHDCQCEGAGCHPPTVAGVPARAVRAGGVAPAPVIRVHSRVTAFLPHRLLRGAVAARAPPTLL